MRGSGERGFKKVCQLTIHTIEELARMRDEVSDLLDRRVIPTQQLEYPSFNNTTEIIP